MIKVLKSRMPDHYPYYPLQYAVAVKERYPSGRQFGAVFYFVTKPTARQMRRCVKLGKQAIRKAEQRVDGELIGVRESE